MTTEESPEPVIRRPRGIIAGLRALVRQLAAAVYIAIIYGIVAHKLGQHHYTWLAEAALVFLGTALAGFVIEGPWWSSCLVGFFVGVLDSLVVGVINGLGGSWRGLIPLAVPVVVSTLVGVAGGLLGRLLARRRQSV